MLKDWSCERIQVKLRCTFDVWKLGWNACVFQWNKTYVHDKNDNLLKKLYQIYKLFNLKVIYEMLLLCANEHRESALIYSWPHLKNSAQNILLKICLFAICWKSNFVPTSMETAAPTDRCEQVQHYIKRWRVCEAIIRAEEAGRRNLFFWQAMRYCTILTYLLTSSCNWTKWFFNGGYRYVRLKF